MKINLQFEKSDLEEMLTEYFRNRGFAVQNMVHVVQHFEATWPEGLEVAALTLPPELMLPSTASKPAPAATNSYEYAADAPVTQDDAGPEEEVVEQKSNGKGNPRLSADDLFDPNGPRRAPTAEQIIDETSRELKNILAQSNELANTQKPKR